MTELAVSEQNLQTGNRTTRLPGDLAMWFFILAELAVFAIFFIGFAVAEKLNPTLFATGKSYLHTMVGGFNTLALITGSWCVARAMQSIYRQKIASGFRWLMAANLCGLTYLIAKSWEYAALFAQGFDISTDTFFGLYFFITFFHFMHVILGMVILIIMMSKLRKENHISQFSNYESGAAYWHMVDLVWVILFPLIYVL